MIIRFLLIILLKKNRIFDEELFYILYKNYNTENNKKLIDYVQSIDHSYFSVSLLLSILWGLPFCRQGRGVVFISLLMCSTNTDTLIPRDCNFFPFCLYLGNIHCASRKVQYSVMFIEIIIDSKY